jgi:hypothetical protein
MAVTSNVLSIKGMPVAAARFDLSRLTERELIRELSLTEEALLVFRKPSRLGEARTVAGLACRTTALERQAAVIGELAKRRDGRSRGRAADAARQARLATAKEGHSGRGHGVRGPAV